MDVALRKLEMSREEALNLLHEVKPSSKREADKLLSYLCEAEDLIEVIEYEIQKLKPPTYTSVSGRCILVSLKNLTKPRQIDELQKKMAKIIDVLKEQVDLSQRIQPLIKTSPPNKKLNLIGRDADVPIILEELTCSEKYSSNGVSIIGMRGVGKTALAEHILNHKKVQAKFPLILQASMFGTRFCMEDLFSKLQVVYSEGRLNGNGQGHLLGCDKWLLMLDDLEEVSSNTWCNFQTEFLTAGKKILITSLSPRVGKMAQTTLLYLKPLLEEHCRDLIRHKIDLVHRCGRCPPPQPSISFDLAKKSCGLPLVATFLAQSLLGTKEQDQWFIHDDLWKWPEIEKEILPILKSSSMNLKLELKRCFVYFSLFPHDYVFCREDLIHMWIGERLVEPHASGFELNGQNFFNELLERSIVQPQPVDSCGLTRYEIHKFTHDFAQMPAGSKAYVRSGDECMSSSYEWDKYTHHFSLSSNKQIQPSLWDKIRKHLKSLRTLLLLYNRQKIGRIGEIPSNFFDKLSGLKVLALNNTDISDLPNSVKKLKHLRYLDISNTKVKKLPEKLANLSALQILKIRTDPEIPQLPVDFNKLTNLAFIDWQESYTENGL
ncbi:putative disease resistance protein At3g14460 [Chenopodium quinoa]|uniref:putative disease resistance protein At3g14460 n=1 Tax=Chenopodium quinoa TaxID=63459 RepID=UPI000B773F03|nr:putative disease resistance protein At3g14460 [Chenopodium quinoa]